MTGRIPEPLLGVLEEARELGLLGPGPVTRQYEHARDLAGAIGEFTGRLLDLGSGGGLPGLVLVHEWPEAQAVLLDAQRRRCEFLAGAIGTLDLGSRVSVECGRAEVLARDERLRSTFDLVVARSFGTPAATAECSVGFLRGGGELIVTEPPEGNDASGRWDDGGLGQLGFGPPTLIHEGETGAVRMKLVGAADDRWPRRDGVPTKRPLW